MAVFMSDARMHLLFLVLVLYLAYLLHSARARAADSLGALNSLRARHKYVLTQHKADALRTQQIEQQYKHREAALTAMAQTARDALQIAKNAQARSVRTSAIG